MAVTALHERTASYRTRFFYAGGFALGARVDVPAAAGICPERLRSANALGGGSTSSRQDRWHQAITVLGTCQDDVLHDAADFTQEIVFFEYDDNRDLLNRPVRPFGYDPDGARRTDPRSSAPWPIARLTVPGDLDRRVRGLRRDPTPKSPVRTSRPRAAPGAHRHRGRTIEIRDRRGRTKLTNVSLYAPSPAEPLALSERDLTFLLGASRRTWPTVVRHHRDPGRAWQHAC